MNRELQPPPPANAKIRPAFLATAGWLAAALLSGCLPVERLWWSPDGERALVLLDDGLRLVDREGRTLLAGASSGAEDSRFQTRSVLWLPGDAGIVALEEGRYDSWQELRPFLPADDAATVERLAAALPGLAAALLAFDSETGTDEAPTPSLSIDSLLAAMPGGGRGTRQSALALSARSHADAWATLGERPGSFAADLRRALASPPDFVLHRLRAGQVEDFLCGSEGPDRVASNTQEGSVSEPTGSDAGAARLLALGFERLYPPQLSPCGRELLWGREIATAAAGGSETVRLERSALGGESGGESGRAAILHEGAHAAYAWGPDGASVYFLAPVLGAPSPLRQLQRIALPSKGGDSADDHLVETLAVTAAPFLPAMSVLPDGRVLFSGQALSFPLDPEGALEESSFFLHDPTSRETRRVPTPPGALPTNLGHFAPCPAGERVAVVESDSDALAVVTLATGQVELVSPPNRGWSCRTLPTWRSAGELSYAAADPDSGRVRWMRWTDPSGAEPLPGPAEEAWHPERTAAWMDYREPKPADSE